MSIETGQGQCRAGLGQIRGRMDRLGFDVRQKHANTVFFQTLHPTSRQFPTNPKETLKKASFDFPRICLRWQIKPRQDKPPSTKNGDQDRKTEHFLGYLQRLSEIDERSDLGFEKKTASMCSRTRMFAEQAQDKSRARLEGQGQSSAWCARWNIGFCQFDSITSKMYDNMVA